MHVEAIRTLVRLFELTHECAVTKHNLQAFIVIIFCRLAGPNIPADNLARVESAYQYWTIVYVTFYLKYTLDPLFVAPSVDGVLALLSPSVCVSCFSGMAWCAP